MYCICPQFKLHMVVPQLETKFNIYQKKLRFYPSPENPNIPREFWIKKTGAITTPGLLARLRYVKGFYGVLLSMVGLGRARRNRS